MFVEEVKFESNQDRDEFIKETVDIHVTEDEISESASKINEDENLSLDDMVGRYRAKEAIDCVSLKHNLEL